MIHVIGDFIQSVGVLVAAIILSYRPEWTIIDPLCTFLFSVLVVFTTLPIAKDCLNILSNSEPFEFTKPDFIDELKQVKSVKAVRSVKVWSLTLEN